MKQFIPHDEPVVMTMTYRGVEYSREAVMRHVQTDLENKPGWPFSLASGSWVVEFPSADIPDFTFRFDAGAAPVSDPSLNNGGT